MKRLLLILILTLSFQSLTKADDIKDFQIEGISVGDSLLDYYSEAEINSKNKNYYKDKDFLRVDFNPENSIYDKISYTFKPKDKKYILHSVRGVLVYENNQECLIKKDSINIELSQMFKNSKVVDSGKRDHASDPTGESKGYSIYYWINGAFVEISCYDFTEKLSKKKKWLKNTLNINVVTKEFSDFLLTKHFNNDF